MTATLFSTGRSLTVELVKSFFIGAGVLVILAALLFVEVRFGAVALVAVALLVGYAVMRTVRLFKDKG
jgi:hypothetical protein